MESCNVVLERSCWGYNFLVANSSIEAHMKMLWTHKVTTFITWEFWELPLVSPRKKNHFNVVWKGPRRTPIVGEGKTPLLLIKIHSCNITWGQTFIKGCCPTLQSVILASFFNNRIFNSNFVISDPSLKIFSNKCQMVKPISILWSSFLENLLL
jgi:hypothetical protein